MRFKAVDFRRVFFLLFLLVGPSVLAQSFPISQTPSDKEAQAQSLKSPGLEGNPSPQAKPSAAGGGIVPATKPQVPRRKLVKKSRDSGVRFGFGLNYSVWQSWIFSGSVSVGAGTGFSAYINLPAALSLDFDVRYLPKNSLGFIGSFTYDLSNRTEAGGRYGTADASAEYAAGNFAISVMTLHANLAWRSGDVFYPLGLNYSIPKIVSSYYTNSLSVKGGLGWNLGIGYYFTSNFAAETYLKSLTAGFSGTGPSTDTFDKGSLLMAGLNLKYIY